MKAVVFHDVGDIRLEDVPDPEIHEPTDAIIRLTASAICGTDLHMVRGTMPGMRAGTILGHEGVGIVEEVGGGVRNLRPGDRVVIPSTIGCGSCSYCRAGYYAQCDHANPQGARAGTAFFGGPEASGPFDGLQAELARVPYANVGPVRLPDEVDDDAAILLSDILPTGYFGADIEVRSGDTVAVYGCGPVGQFAIASAWLMGAGRVLAVDRIESRLDMARQQDAEAIHFEDDDPVEAILELTHGIGVDRAIDAVGVDAEPATRGPASGNGVGARQREQVERYAPDADPDGDLWRPGRAPTQALEWTLRSLAKAGTLGIIGVYPEPVDAFPIGLAMNRNLTLNMGNCNHRAYIPELVNHVAAGTIHPVQVLSRRESFEDVIEAYEHFDRREDGWMKVKLEPGDRREPRESPGREPVVAG